MYTRRRQQHPTKQYSCLENPMDGGAWQAAVHGVAKSQTRQSDFTFTFHFHALEKEMATHSSVLARRIPGTGEPDGLPPWGHTESDTTEATQQQQQQPSHMVRLFILLILSHHSLSTPSPNLGAILTPLSPDLTLQVTVQHASPP